MIFLFLSRRPHPFLSLSSASCPSAVVVRLFTRCRSSRPMMMMKTVVVVLVEVVSEWWLSRWDSVLEMDSPSCPLLPSPWPICVVAGGDLFLVAFRLIISFIQFVFNCINKPIYSSLNNWQQGKSRWLATESIASLSIHSRSVWPTRLAFPLTSTAVHEQLTIKSICTCRLPIYLFFGEAFRKQRLVFVVLINFSQRNFHTNHRE